MTGTEGLAFLCVVKCGVVEYLPGRFEALGSAPSIIEHTNHLMGQPAALTGSALCLRPTAWPDSNKIPIAAQTAPPWMVFLSSYQPISSRFVVSPRPRMVCLTDPHTAFLSPWLRLGAWSSSEAVQRPWDSDGIRGTDCPVPDG